MSEYQYYEFLAVDRPLSSEQIAELRQLSSRAGISSTRFVNHYNFGDFRGNPDRLMEGYFDAHLYLANWGTHRLMFRIPANTLDLGTAQQYCDGETSEVRSHGDHLILDLRVDDELGEYGYYEGPDTLGEFISARGELIAGDHRLLYIAWLLEIQWIDPEWENDDLDLDEVEPPVPPGLDSLSGALQGIVEFLRVDQDLLAIAAQGNREVRRTVGQLLDAVAAERAAEAQRAEEEARRAHHERMEALARRENALWQRVVTLIDTRSTQQYDAAVDVLTDLRELAGWRSSDSAFASRIGELRETYGRLHGLMRRFDTAGLP